MRNRIKQLLQSFWFWVAVIFIVYFLLNLSLIHQNDDFSFYNIYQQQGGLRKFIIRYASVWSGRIIPHTLMVYLFRFPDIIFQTLNAICMTIVVLYGYWFCTGYQKKFLRYEKLLLAGIAFFILYLPPAGMVAEAVFWKSATVLYVWGLAATFIAVSPFIRAYYGQKVSKGESFLALLGAIYASNFEQTGPIVLAVAAILAFMIYVKHRKIFIINIFIFVIGLAGFLISIGIPGNTIRYHAEVLAHMPQYDTFTFLDKIYFGTGYTFDFLYKNFSLVLFLISLVCMFIILRSNRHLLLKCSTSVTTLFFGAVYFYSFAGSFFTTVKIPFGIDRFFLNFPDFNSTEVYLQTAEMCSLFFSILFFLHLSFIILTLFPDGRGIISALFWVAAFCDVFIMSFSPTVYASSVRVGMISSICLTMVLFNCIYYASCKFKPDASAGERSL